MRSPGSRAARLGLCAAVAVLAGACGTSAPSVTRGVASPRPSSTVGAGSAAPAASGNSTLEPVFTPIPDASQAPDTGAGTAHGDIPDNAVFLTYHSAAWGFSIQYVEGWQVTTQTDGVTIRDKDSSEAVRVIPLPKDVAAYVSGTDLPALQASAGFRLVKRNTAQVGSQTYIHLAYHALSDPDPVTGKQVSSTVDRFYVPGPGLAIVSLSTPDGVDNVDAFRQLITSFK
ncbi:MAG: hypothetical protein M3067_04400 [Chloroflexota bacterium]|nr:hypothetical protein [Chloroflexota bacterium]